MLASLAVLTACNNEESFDIPDAGKLSINVGVNNTNSRSLITAATLPDGDEGAIGVMLTDGDGTLTDYDAFTNVKFTGTTASGSQKWTGATDVLLTENPGTLYAYYPWKDGTDLSAITIETASQTDYLYATPVTGISETKANADVVMNHVLTNINLSFADGTYAGGGNITSVSVSGDGIAIGGTFNAAQETPGFVADSYKGVGDAITNTTATTLGGNAIDIMVVSNDAEKPITIAATIDGVEYTATTTAVELAKGNSYQYTLTLNSTFMSVSKVSVTEWNPVTKDNLTLDKVDEFDKGIVTTYYIDETKFVSRTGGGLDVNILSASTSFSLTSVERMKVDGVEVKPSLTYTFTSGGKHIVKYLLKDNSKVPIYMFMGCTGLTEVTIPESVTSIGDYAFASCSGLTEFTIPNSVTSIGERAFYNCSGLTGTLTIPNSVTSIEKWAFSGCSGITDLIIGSRVGYIEEYTFKGMTKLSSIKSLRLNAVNIDPYAFTGIKYGGIITVPRGAKGYDKWLRDEQFTPGNKDWQCIEENSMAQSGIHYYSDGKILYMCEKNYVGDINIRDGVEYIYPNAFKGCTGLTSVTIPNSVKTIGDGAFCKCDALTSVTIPNSVTTIGKSAFYNCSGLTGTLTIPNSVTSIGASAFSGCSGLTGTLTIPNSVQTIGYGVFYSCSGLTEVTIPEAVKTIESWAFRACSGLTEIEIPTSVTLIGNAAFCECSNLVKITCYAQTAPTISNETFRYVKENGILYVPVGATGYDTWMSTSSYYLGKYNWTKQEITE